MSENILILKREDVEISRTREANSGRIVMILDYYGRNFRLMSQFDASQKEKAIALCQNLMESRGKPCILLEQGNQWSVWLEIQPQTAIATKPVFPKKLPRSDDNLDASLTQTSLLIIQAIADDIEDLMGNNYKISFQQELTKIFKQCLLPGAESLQPINPLLTINPLATDSLPIWEPKHIKALFPRLGRLSKKYFGSTAFVERTVELLRELPIYNRPKVMNCCMQFVLMCKD